MDQNLLDELLSKKLLLLSGKGGTGKSLTSAALAQQAARKGKKVLIIEWSSREQIAPLFAHEPVGHQEVSLSENIWGINVTAKDSLREYVTNYLGLKKLYEKVFQRKVVRSFLEAIPGLAETMILGRIYHTCTKMGRKYDLVIFDAPASGHFLNLMTTPQAIIQSGLMGPLVGEVKKILEFLSSEDCAIVLMSIPEALIVNETMEFIPQIMDHCPTKLKAVFVNRSLPEDGLIHEELANYGNKIKAFKLPSTI